jgi:hypothetical protein
MLAFVVPFMFFSISGSKLPPYILPVIAPLMVLACAFEREDGARAYLKRTGWELMVLGALFTLVAPFLVKEGGVFGWLLALGVTFLALGTWALRPVHLTGPRWMAVLGAGVLLLSHTAQKVAGPGKDVSHLVQQAPANAQWISCGNYFQGIAFLTGQRVTVLGGTGELAFGRDRLSSVDRDRWFPEGSGSLESVAQALKAESPSRPVWALVSPGAWKSFPPERALTWDVVDRSASAWLVCRK